MTLPLESLLVRDLIKIKERFKCLGLEFAGLENSTGDSGELIQRLDFAHPKSGVQVKISEFIEENRTFTSSVQKSEKVGFLLISYLEYKNRQKEAEELWRLDGESNEDYLERFISNFEVLLCGELKKFITGEFWEEIPFDWMGHK